MRAPRFISLALTAVCLVVSGCTEPSAPTGQLEGAAALRTQAKPVGAADKTKRPAARQNTTSQNAISQNAISQNAISQNAISQNAMPKDAVHGHRAPVVTRPGGTLPDPSSAAALAKWLRPGVHKAPLLSAHRGGPTRAQAENAMATLRAAAAGGPIILEVDVRATKDGRLVLLHDDTLDRTTTGKGRLADTPFSKVHTLKLKAENGTVIDESLPTLDEVVLWARGNAVLALDIKEGVRFERVLNTLKRHRAMGSAMLIVYSAGALRRLAKLSPDVVVSVSMDSERDVQDVLAVRGANPSRLVGFVGVGQASKALIDTLHAKNISTIVGTFGFVDRATRVGRPGPLGKITAAGADIIATDHIAPTARLLYAGADANKGANPHTNKTGTGTGTGINAAQPAVGP